MWKSRWPSWAFRPNEPYGFCGRKAILNHAYALVSLSLICQPASEDIKLYIIIETAVCFFGDSPHVYLRAWTICWFHNLISIQAFRSVLTASLHGQLREDKECPFSGANNSDRVWRKEPESDVRSVAVLAVMLTA